MLLPELSHPSLLSIVIKTFSRTLRARVTSSSNRMMASSAKAPPRLNSGDSEQAFIYGTAWKKDQTKRLVKEALTAGFRKVDTAAQPRHYQEELVGQAIREAIREDVVRREDLYVSDVLIVDRMVC